MSERKNRIAGFNEDGTTYTQQIYRRTPGPDGKMGYYPPKPGQTTTSTRGPFHVYEILGVFQGPNGKYYYTARGEVIGQRRG